MKSFLKKYRKRIYISFAFIWAIHFYFCLPSPLFNTPYSKVLFASNGDILSVKIAEDEQWRIPYEDSLSFKYQTCLLQYEDEHFYRHPGINPFSLCRAFYNNLKNGAVTSGGSTISMQVIRLSKSNPPRTIWEKIKEIYLAIRLECSYSKKEILSLYANHAPFGGNVVGISAAGWKYFGRNLNELSWAEAATLAVLPNSPSLIFPGKNQSLLKKKRNKLLEKLAHSGIIDTTTLSLAQEESLPSKFISYPRKASHALEFLSKNSKRSLFSSSINYQWQEKANEIIQHHISQYSGNHIYNAAALIVDNESKEVLCYVGNSFPFEGDFHENFVDLIHAKRSTGSILKPFLHAAALDDGIILNESILPDIPTIIQGFSPQNYTKTYEGAVHANIALAKSLNIPAVRLLKRYKYSRFHSKLKDLGMTTLSKSPDHYGLSLILGGSEATLWDLTAMYSGLASTLNQFEEAPMHKSYSESYFSKPTLVPTKKKQAITYTSDYQLSAPSIYLTCEALSEVKRPTEEGEWKMFRNSKKIAWKTGTSHGFRDAWAIGTTSKYTVSVWVGNASGEGRPDLVGIKKAAPIMFSLFNILPSSKWFEVPKREMTETNICELSGYKASENCKHVTSTFIGKTGLTTGNCNYCRTVTTNTNGLRVNSSCYNVEDMHHEKFFILPPVQEWYYKQKSASYKKLPNYDSNCINDSEMQTIDLIYPHHGAKIYIPKELDGERSSLICRAVHKDNESTIYWHLNDSILGQTKDNHQMPIPYQLGTHTLTIIDSKGNKKSILIEIL